MTDTPHARAHIHKPAQGLILRLAVGAVRVMGSTGFLLAQTAVVLAWIALNVTAIVHHWDPYPFILLNLAFSTQAAYAAPFILLAQNREAERDRARDDLEAAEVAGLYQINQEQIEILRLLRVLVKEDAQ